MDFFLSPSASCINAKHPCSQFSEYCNFFFGRCLLPVSTPNIHVLKLTESCHSYGRVMSHMNGSCHTHEWVMFMSPSASCIDAKHPYSQFLEYCRGYCIWNTVRNMTYPVECGVLYGNLRGILCASFRQNIRVFKFWILGANVCGILCIVCNSVWTSLGNIYKKIRVFNFFLCFWISCGILCRLLRMGWLRLVGSIKL